MFFSNNSSIELAKVTKLEEKDEHIIVTIKALEETFTGRKMEAEEEIILDKDAEMNFQVFEVEGYTHHNVSLEFISLKEAELKALRDYKEDMIKKYNEHIAEYEKIKNPLLP